MSCFPEVAAECSNVLPLASRRLLMSPPCKSTRAMSRSSFSPSWTIFSSLANWRPRSRRFRSSSLLTSFSSSTSLSLRHSTKILSVWATSQASKAFCASSPVARSKGRCPARSFRLGSDPDSSNRAIASMCPLKAALWRGVRPSCWAPLGSESLKLSSRWRMTSVCPWTAASDSAEAMRPSSAYASAPCSRAFFSPSRSPSKAHSRSSVSSFCCFTSRSSLGLSPPAHTASPAPPAAATSKAATLSARNAGGRSLQTITSRNASCGSNSAFTHATLSGACAFVRSWNVGASTFVMASYCTRGANLSAAFRSGAYVSSRKTASGSSASFGKVLGSKMAAAS
mmetsp:Transcript_98419/g.267177  ORF Transcript_98419/g.267177 Transcript_98419/m.267177 type:complete len:340 (-) Transcript_98419:238-1257(-)